MRKNIKTCLLLLPLLFCFLTQLHAQTGTGTANCELVPNKVGAVCKIYSFQGTTETEVRRQLQQLKSTIKADIRSKFASYCDVGVCQTGDCKPSFTFDVQITNPTSSVDEHGTITIAGQVCIAYIVSCSCL